MKYVAALLAALAFAGLGIWIRATRSTPVELEVGPDTTVILGPLLPQGGVDYDAAMGASAASEQRLELLLAVLESDPASEGCTPLASEPRGRLVEIVREPLRMRRPASHVTPASQQLATRLLVLLRRLRCSCTEQPAQALDAGHLLAAVSAYLSSSNQDTFYQLHSLAARAATGCFALAPAEAARDVSTLRFFDVSEHLELVRLGLLEEIVMRQDPHFDANVALRAFNEDFMRAADGAELPPPVQPATSWLQSASEQRSEKSAFVGRSHAQLVPEIVAATRTAHENTVNERRAWKQP
ncbi:MAG: hypothetical protein ABW352_15705 [Polyangiales bacterium]